MKMNKARKKCEKWRRWYRRGPMERWHVAGGGDSVRSGKHWPVLENVNL